MNTNTPYFRFALTISFVWLIVIAYIAYGNFDKSYKDVEFSKYNVPKDLTENCYYDNLKWVDGETRFVAPNANEKKSCYEVAYEQNLSNIKISNDFVVSQSWDIFIEKGISPVAILLFCVGFWKSIFEFTNKLGSSYLRWLRFGARPPEDYNDKGE